MGSGFERTGIAPLRIATVVVAVVLITGSIMWTLAQSFPSEPDSTARAIGNRAGLASSILIGLRAGRLPFSKIIRE